MTRITALVIQTNENNIRCEVYGRDVKTRKFAGAINLYRDGHLHTTLISSEFVYGSSKIAIKAMEEVVQKVRSMDALI